MRTILQAENLTKVYRVGSVDVPALRGVSLDVEEGEILVRSWHGAYLKGSYLNASGIVRPIPGGRMRTLERLPKPNASMLKAIRMVP